MTTLELLARTTSERAAAREAFDAADREWRTAIKAARVEGYSQAAIADTAGITQGRVAQILGDYR